MTESEQIEKHVDKHNGGWYVILQHYYRPYKGGLDAVRFEWGRDDRSWTKTLDLKSGTIEGK